MLADMDDDYKIKNSINGGPNRDVYDNNESGLGNIRWRHNGDDASAFLFLDGHAESLSYNNSQNDDDDDPMRAFRYNGTQLKYENVLMGW